MIIRIGLILGIGVLLVSCNNIEPQQQNNREEAVRANTTQHEYAMVIHGGAGYMSPEKNAEEEQLALKATMDSLLLLGKELLVNNADAVDVVSHIITIMEDDPRFNAGRGAVFAENGKNELDASIMQGSDLNAGAVAGVSTVRHPILAAKEVMENSRHVFMSGAGAESFAKEQGLELVNNDYFFTQKKYDRLKMVQKEAAKTGFNEEPFPDSKYGTVGCVVLDKKGNIVAGTSTGGLTNKKYNRIGDSPVIGAGTYANNRTCGVSCTGVGEFFIRYAIAHEVSSQYMHTNRSIKQIADELIHGTLKEINADGGLIALDKFGNVAMPFNTTAMLRGYINEEEKIVALFRSEGKSKEN